MTDGNLQYAIEKLTLAIEQLEAGKPEHVLGLLVIVKERLHRVRAAQADQT